MTDKHDQVYNISIQAVKVREKIEEAVYNGNKKTLTLNAKN
jgi:hypothetical protein